MSEIDPHLKGCCRKLYFTGHAEWDSGDVYREQKECPRPKNHEGKCGPPADTEPRKKPESCGFKHTWIEVWCNLTRGHLGEHGYNTREVYDATRPVGVEQAKLREALEGCLEQLVAYEENGWLGDAWRTRVGLRTDIARARIALGETDEG